MNSNILNEKHYIKNEKGIKIIEDITVFIEIQRVLLKKKEINFKVKI